MLDGGHLKSILKAKVFQSVLTGKVTLECLLDEACIIMNNK